VTLRSIIDITKLGLISVCLFLSQLLFIVVVRSDCHRRTFSICHL